MIVEARLALTTEHKNQKIWLRRKCSPHQFLSQKQDSVLPLNQWTETSKDVLQDPE